jgi:phosphatidate cytidylyltransferase
MLCPVLKYRLPLGILLIATLVGLLWLDETLAGKALPSPILGQTVVPPGLVIFTVMLPISFMAARELGRIMREKGIHAQTGLTCGAALTGLIATSAVPRSIPADHGASIVASAAIVVMLASLVYYSRRQNTQGVVAAAGGTLLSFTYLGLMFGCILTIRRDHSAWLLLWILVVTKACDTGAYFTGRAVGRHKLIPWLSPGKTWEGLAGGIVFAATVAVLGVLVLRKALPDEPLPSEWEAAVVGACCAVVGQLGDLMMSLFKRDAGRKDSGHSLPGFGGVLDVLDSPLLVMPFAVWWLRWFVER